MNGTATAEKKSTRIPVSVDNATHDLLKKLSNDSGVPMAKILANAVKFYSLFQGLEFDSVTIDRIRAYSGVFGMTFARAVVNAVKDWFETVGDARMDAVANNPIQFSNLIPFRSDASKSPEVTGN